MLPCLQQLGAKRGFRPCKDRGDRSRPLIACATGSAGSSAAVGSGRGRSAKRDQNVGWAQEIAKKQRKQIRQLDRITDRIQNQLLDLDLDEDLDDPSANVEDGMVARVRSNAAASSSTAGNSRSKRRGSSRASKRPRRQGARGARVPPSAEVLVALLRRADSKRALLRELDVRSPRAVASRLQLLGPLLGLSAERLVALCRKCGRLLLRRPEQLLAALTALEDCLKAIMARQPQPQPRTAPPGEQASGGWSRTGGGSGSGGGGESWTAAEALAREMLAAAPELLLVSPERLRRSGLEFGAVFKARGVKALPLLSARPDLLLQSSASLAAKMDLLPGLLGLPPKRLREVLAARPDLLRRSPRQLSRRYQLLGELCGVPPDFLSELVAQEPGVLGFGADTLRAKFEALAGQYGRFQDDVADMILVDPAVLINAPPAPAAAAAASAAAGGGAAAADGVLPVLDQMLQLSSASGVPLNAVLQLVVQEERVCRYSREEVAAQLEALAAALGLEECEVRSRVAAHPSLLLLPAEQLAGRVEALTRLLQPPPDGGGPRGSGSGGGGAVAAGSPPAVPAALALVRSQPELLLQDPVELYSRLTQLSSMLLGTAAAPGTAMSAPDVDGTPAGAEAGAGAGAAPPLPARLFALVASQPALLTAPLEETADKLLVMQSLFEIPRALVLELVLREPALLAVSGDELQRKFRALAASFGAFSADAIDVVLADPSLILRADDIAGSNTSSSSSSSSSGGPGGTLTPLPRQMPKAVKKQRSRSQASDEGADTTGASGARAAGSRGADLAGVETGTSGRSGSRSGSSPVAAAATDDEAARSERSGQQQYQQQQHGSIGGAARAAADQTGGGGGAQRRRRTDAGSEPETGARPSAAPRQPPRVGEEPAGSGGSGSGAGAGKGADMGLLGVMSAADFDKLGSEDLPPPPPPSARRRRRLQQEK